MCGHSLRCSAIPRRAHSYYYGRSVLKKPGSASPKKIWGGLRIGINFHFQLEGQVQKHCGLFFSPHLARPLEVHLQFYTIIIAIIADFANHR